MAYVDLEFYKSKYYGTVVPDAEFPQFAERASNFVDTLTFDRLVEGFPVITRDAEKVKKAVCSVADKLYEFEIAEKNALAAAQAGSSKTTYDNVDTTGVVTAVSSGSESITYASPGQLAGSAKEWSAMYGSVGNEREMNNILARAATVPYLIGVRSSKGVLLLYAGL